MMQQNINGKLKFKHVKSKNEHATYMHEAALK